MSVKEKLKDPNSVLTVNVGPLLIEINRKLSQNTIYLRSILKRQLELKEILRKTPESEIKPLVESKLKHLTFQISQFSETKNSEDLEIFLK